MLELHRYKHVDWKPSPVVSLAASVDGTVLAAGRGNGSIEIWTVSPGSVGWHCELTIPGKQDASLSCLLWCPSNTCRWGRLFSAGLDGFISEWDLSTLRPKEILSSYGGSIWQMAIEPFTVARVSISTRIVGPDQNGAPSSDNDTDNGEDEENNKEGEEKCGGEKRIAIACDDGCMRFFTVEDGQSMMYKNAFPRVEGRILSIAWSVDAERIYSGGSDGCIRCWDARLSRELYRITAGLGGSGSESNLCIWSILSLKDGTVVTGDSSGSTQFWDGKHGTFLQALTSHKADVLALAASPSHQSVFAAGADGQVVQYQHVHASKIMADVIKKSEVDVGIGLGDKWVYVGYKRNHSHDVNSLVVACPPQVTDNGDNVTPSLKRLKREPKKLKKSWMDQNQLNLDPMGIPMLISGGNDAKLFTYPANAFLAFQPHDVCYAPQRTPISLATKQHHGLIMMAQHEHQLDIWKMVACKPSDTTNLQKNESASQSQLGKRKSEESPNYGARQRTANGHLKDVAKDFANGHDLSKSHISCASKQFVKMKGLSPELLARIKCKSAENITCSALSGCGELVAFSDQSKPRLFELHPRPKVGLAMAEVSGITKRNLPKNLPPAHCMVFSGSSLLILACLDQAVWVVDTQTSTVQHRFEREKARKLGAAISPITSICASLDGQWLATCDARGDITVFNLETFEQHWLVPPLDGDPVTAATFHSGSNGLLIVTTSANVLHVLDVEAKRLGEWSRQHGNRLPRTFLEFPGGIQGLSFCPSTKSTTVIAYSSKGMCFIDFKKPVPHDEEAPLSSPAQNSVLSNGTGHSGKQQNGNCNGSHNKNFVMVPFKDPVLFVGHISDESILIIEKPWVEAINELPPPVYRHLYGT